MLLRDVHQRLQAAVTQPALHPLKPLRCIVHLRRHGTDHHDRFRTATGGFLHRYRVTDPAVQIADAVQQGAGTIKTGNGAGGADDVQPVLLLRREIARGIVIPPTGAHPKLFSAIKQTGRRVHCQRHLAGGRLQQPVEIDQVAAAHKAHRVKKFFRRGVAHNHFSRVARLVADIG